MKVFCSGFRRNWRNNCSVSFFHSTRFDFFVFFDKFFKLKSIVRKKTCDDPSRLFCVLCTWLLDCFSEIESGLTSSIANEDTEILVFGKLKSFLCTWLLFRNWIWINFKYCERGYWNFSFRKRMHGMLNELLILLKYSFSFLSGGSA